MNVSEPASGWHDRARPSRGAGRAQLLVAALVVPLSVATALARAQPSTVSPPAASTDEEAANQLLELAGDGFRIYETDHFVICYDTSFDLLRPLVGRLEGTFDAVWRFATKSGIDVTPPDGRMRVLFFDKQVDYARHAHELNVDPVTVAGFYSSTKDLAVFSNTLTRPTIENITREMERLGERITRSRQSGTPNRAARKRREVLARQVSSLHMQRDRLVEQFNQLVIQHEASHQVFFHIGVHRVGVDNPTWLAEGLACQFEVPQTRRDGKLTTVNHMRLADFREALGVDRSTKRLRDDAYRAAVHAPTWVPLREFVADPARFRDGGANIAFRYGQAWGLVFYLGRKHDKAFAAYVSRLAQATPGERFTAEQRLSAFEAAFGSADEMEKKWIAFMLQLRVDWQAAGR